MPKKYKEGMRECKTCEGTGEIEGVEYECNDSTGYNTIAMGNGKYEECPDCEGSGEVDEEYVEEYS